MRGGLRTHHRGESALLLHKFIRGALLNDAAVTEDNDRVGELGARETVRDDDRGAPCRGVAHSTKHHLFRIGVERCGGFVEKQDRRIAEKRARNRDKLALAARERVITRDRLVQAERHFANHPICTCLMSDPLDILSGRVGHPEADVVGDRSREEMLLLRHECEAVAEFSGRNFTQIGAVNADSPVAWLVEPREKTQERRLSRTGFTDDCDRLPRADPERNIFERRGAVFVGIRQPVDDNLTPRDP